MNGGENGESIAEKTKVIYNKTDYKYLFEKKNDEYTARCKTAGGKGEIPGTEKGGTKDEL